MRKAENTLSLTPVGSIRWGRASELAPGIITSKERRRGQQNSDLKKGQSTVIAFLKFNK
jgi:hypothetical protein